MLRFLLRIFQNSEKKGKSSHCIYEFVNKLIDQEKEKLHIIHPYALELSARRTSKGLKKQQAPRQEYESQILLPLDLRKTWHQKQNSPLPAHTEKTNATQKRLSIRLMKEPLEVHFDTGGCAHLVCWNFLGCARRTNNKMNICHEFVIEHQSIPVGNKMQ